MDVFNGCFLVQLSKGIWNIYLEVTIEKKLHTQNFDFLSLKSLSPSQFLGSSHSRTYYWIFKLLVETYAKLYVWLFYYFHFERSYDVLKTRSLRFLLNKNINFNKNETESKMENPTYSFREMKLVLQPA